MPWKPEGFATKVARPPLDELQPGAGWPWKMITFNVPEKV